MAEPATLREETPADATAVRTVNRLAFGGELEARIVERLHAEGVVLVSLVAVTGGGEVAGHVMFTRLPIETETGTLPAAAMAPVAVLPKEQGRGIGSDLVRGGLEQCRQRGCTAVIVLGEPAYYTRFGFSADLTTGIAGPFSGAEFMGVELIPGALRGVTGKVTYPKAFFDQE